MATVIQPSRNFRPHLSESQFSTRIRLVEKRLTSYPLDRLDFIMTDLEHPKGVIRHAHQCTTDLTGRSLEFFATARMVLDGLDDSRMNEQFHRMTRAGMLGGLIRRYFPYFEYTNDSESLGLIEQRIREYADAFGKAGSDEEKEETAKRFRRTCSCPVEALGRMYDRTGDPVLLDMGYRIGIASLCPFEGAHSHGLMTVLRSLLYCAIVSGQQRFLDLVDPYIPKIRAAQRPDGSICEAFPVSFRTEGCSIADWVILCLYYYDCTGDAESLEIAEHTLLNGLFFNQFVTGGFGHRTYEPYGYATEIEEAWWCCAATGGLAICEYARHAVRLENGTICVHYPVPGVYTLLDGGREIRVTISSSYPAEYRALIRVEGDPSLPVRVRIPYYVKDGHVTESVTRDGSAKNLVLEGRIGHYIEPRGDEGDYAVKYGPLMLAPMIYNSVDYSLFMGDGIPDGYVQKSLGGQRLTLIGPEEGPDGFLAVAAGDDLPEWVYFEDGPGARTGTGNRALAKIDMRTEAGYVQPFYLHPLCYQTSTLVLCHTPIVFGLAEKKQV